MNGSTHVSDRLGRLRLGAVLAALAATCLTGATTAGAGVIVYSDAAFNAADYVATPTYTSGANVTVTPTFGGSLRVEIADPATEAFAGSVGFVNTGFTFNPLSQGPLHSVAASVDKLIELAFGNLNGYTGVFGNTFRPLIEQGGLYFMATIAGPVLPGNPAGGPYTDSLGPTTISQAGLLATDFFQFDFATGLFGLAHPDFNGGLMRFGLGQVSTSGGFTFTDSNIVATYDNLEFTLQVPEPGSLALFAAGLLAAGIARRKAGSTV